MSQYHPKGKEMLDAINTDIPLKQILETFEKHRRRTVRKQPRITTRNFSNPRWTLCVFCGESIQIRQGCLCEKSYKYCDCGRPRAPKSIACDKWPSCRP